MLLGSGVDLDLGDKVSSCFSKLRCWSVQDDKLCQRWNSVSWGIYQLRCEGRVHPIFPLCLSQQYVVCRAKVASFDFDELPGSSVNKCCLAAALLRVKSIHRACLPKNCQFTPALNQSGHSTVPFIYEGYAVAQSPRPWTKSSHRKLPICGLLDLSSMMLGQSNFRISPTSVGLFRRKCRKCFWVKIRALVRPSLQRWTGIDLPIISGVKFWWFSFFLDPL